MLLGLGSKPRPVVPLSPRPQASVSIPRGPLGCQSSIFQTGVVGVGERTGTRALSSSPLVHQSGPASVCLIRACSVIAHRKHVSYHVNNASDHVTSPVASFCK